MATTRREFLTMIGAASGLAATQATAGEGDSGRNNPTEPTKVNEVDPNWQSYVDSGIYPAQAHLFLDDFYVSSIEGLKRVVEKPDHISWDEPVFRPEKPWEGVAHVHRCNAIIYDSHEKLFKLWYGCVDPSIPKNPAKVNFQWAYAVSEDGIHWERPDLGLVEYGGSRKNNLVKLKNVDYSIALLQNVNRDDREPNPNRRFKSIGLSRHAKRPGEISWSSPRGPEHPSYKEFLSKIGCGIYIGYSPDGLRWTMKEGWSASGALIADGSALHGFNPHLNKWVMWQRPRTNPKYRVYGMSVSDDFENWSFPIDAMAPDEHDPVGMQVDSLATLASPDIGYIGLAAMSGYKGEGFKVSEKLPQLVYSRDGRDWTRVDRKPYLTVRDKEAWNGGPLITPINPVQVGDEVFIFYYGKNYGNYWGEKTFDGKSIVTSALGLAKLPRDRWVSLAPKETAGEFTTRLVSFANNELHVNVAASGGTLRAELVDFQQRKPVPGYTLADCDPIQVDSLDKTVTWNGQSDLSRLIGTARQQPLVGRAMAVRFHLERAKLFSFYC